MRPVVTLLAFALAMPEAVPAAAAPVAAAPPRAKAGLTIDDYFRLTHYPELALSSDGKWLAYAAETGADDRTARRIHLQSLTGSTGSASPDILSDASALAWIPGTHRLAFLSARSGSRQLHAYDVRTGKVSQLTRSATPIVSFRFAPTGKAVAYATRAPSDPATSLYEQFRNADRGILIDPDRLSSHDFVNPDWNAMVSPGPVRLWVGDLDGKANAVDLPGDPDGASDSYHWSSDGRALSAVYIDEDMPASQRRSERTSIGIFDTGTRLFRPLARATAPTARAPGRSFAGGEWIPGERRIILRRVTESDPWVSGSFPDWAIVDAATGPSGKTAWKEIELYPSGLDFTPAGGSDIWVENKVEGEQGLFRLTARGLDPAPLTAGLDGSNGQFQFSGGFDTVAFVNQSLSHPPEIFVRSGNGPPRRLTSRNEGIAANISYTSREIDWTSTDGTIVKGWLLEPKGESARPRPLVTHVHGGPAFPFPNEFAPYFDYWPYPLELYPARGMAVFLPNYRGTHSYGRRIAAATGDDKAIEDIVSGVRHLVAAGIADPERLGLSGHSHGALVGPLAMARSKIFRAASFAEGVSNQVVMYELMPGFANREIHDATNGVSLYDSPETYVKGSADLQLSGVSTASLFEAGARTSALFMLGLAKAAERFGMPSEFIIYPKTAHNLAIPALQRESAERNLDWFDFWLNGREDRDPAKAAQYRRWRQAKDAAGHRRNQDAAASFEKKARMER